MKPLILLIVLLVIFSCISVVWQSVEKNHFNREPEIVFYKGVGKDMKVMWKERGTHKDAERIMRSNPQFELYEVDG